MEDDQNLANDDFTLAFESLAAGNKPQLEVDSQPEGEDQSKVEVQPEVEVHPEGEVQPEGEAQAQAQAEAEKKQAQVQAQAAAQAEAEKKQAQAQAQAAAQAEAEKKQAQAQVQAAAQAEADKKRTEAESQAQERIKPTAEEQALLADVEENFPEIAKSFAVIERITMAKMENLFEKRLAELTQSMDQRIAPALVASQIVANNAHEAAILQKHSDAFDLAPKVREWVDKQPTLLKNVYEEIIDNGDAGQVIELLDIFKESTKSVQSQQVPVVDKKAKQEREDKLLSQEGVRARHTASQTAVDPDDFAGAFEKYAAQG